MSNLQASLSLLSWLVLWVLLGSSAHADSTLAPDNNHEYKPTFIASSVRKESSRYGNNARLTAMYGENITLMCSSKNASNLIIQDGENQPLQVKNLNSISVYVSIMPDVGEYRYYCSNNNRTSLMDLTVLPALFVSAKNVRYNFDKHGHFFVPRGEVFNISCSANKPQSLSLIDFSDGSEVYIQSVVVNKNTITSTVVDKGEGDFKYSCLQSDAETIVFVRVDYYPEGKQFECILHQEQKLQCMWKSYSKGNTFKLFVSNDQETPICFDRSGNLTGGCTGVLNEKWSDSVPGNFSLKLQTCNELFCDNQTYALNSTIITKLGPVRNLNISKISSDSAVIQWNHDAMDFVKYKMDYLMIPGTYGSWEQLDTSSVQCEFLSKTCSLQMELPCPDTKYQVRVSVKYQDAPGDIYWSDDVSVLFDSPKGTGITKIQCDPFVRLILQSQSVNGDNSLLNKLVNRLEHKDNGTNYTETVYM